MEFPREFFFSFVASSWAFNTNVSEIDLVWDLKAADFPKIDPPNFPLPPPSHSSTVLLT